ncbi:MAG: DUF2780 domain-containing protein [Myxococcales bacterium]|nr:DUF2780 domain-containing protein [Myxococcales bacterium]
MDEFFQQAAARFGISPDAIRSLTGGLLKKVKADGDDGDFEELAAQVPGVDAAVAAADEAPASGGGLGGGMLGGLLGRAANAVGAGGAVDIAGLFQKAGLDPSQASGYLTSLVDFLKSKVSGGLLERLLDRVPALKSMLG